MLSIIERKLNKVNYELTFCPKSEINKHLKEFNKLYLEMLYYTPINESTEKHKRYLKTYCECIKAKAQRRKNEQKRV